MSDNVRMPLNYIIKFGSRLFFIDDVKAVYNNPNIEENLNSSDPIHLLIKSPMFVGDISRYDAVSLMHYLVRTEWIGNIGNCYLENIKIDINPQRSSINFSIKTIPNKSQIEIITNRNGPEAEVMAESLENSPSRFAQFYDFRVKPPNENHTLLTKVIYNIYQKDSWSDIHFGCLEETNIMVNDVINYSSIFTKKENFVIDKFNGKNYENIMPFMRIDNIYLTDLEISSLSAEMKSTYETNLTLN